MRCRLVARIFIHHRQRSVAEDGAVGLEDAPQPVLVDAGLSVTTAAALARHVLAEQRDQKAVTHVVGCRLEGLEAGSVGLDEVDVDDLGTRPRLGRAGHDAAAAAGSQRVRRRPDLLVAPRNRVVQLQDAAAEAVLERHAVAEVEGIAEEDLAERVDGAAEPRLQARLGEHDPAGFAGIDADEAAVQRRRNEGAEIDTVGVGELLVVQELRLPGFDARQPNTVGAVFVLDPVHRGDAEAHHHIVAVEVLQDRQRQDVGQHLAHEVGAAAGLAAAGGDDAGGRRREDLAADGEAVADPRPRRHVVGEDARQAELPRLVLRYRLRREVDGPAADGVGRGEVAPLVDGGGGGGRGWGGAAVVGDEFEVMTRRRCRR